jgi:hypothetical protein
MCGTFWLLAAGRAKRRTVPGTHPSPGSTPSSLSPSSSCMPRQMPSTGMRSSSAFAFSTGRSSSRRMFVIALSNAPTPGSTSLRACAMTCGSDVMVVAAPTRRNMFATEPRLPMP